MPSWPWPPAISRIASRRERRKAWDAQKSSSRAGRGGEVATFRDVNQGEVFDISTTAAAYVSFFDPAGPALMARNAGNLKGAKLLWVVGTGDPAARAAARGGEIVTVQAAHGNTPSVGTGKVVAWLRSQ